MRKQSKEQRENKMQLKKPVCLCGALEFYLHPPDYIDVCAECGTILEGQIEPDNIVDKSNLSLFCPQCGEQATEFYESYCKECRDENQKELDNFNNEQAIWNKLTSKQKDELINK